MNFRTCVLSVAGASVIAAGLFHWTVQRAHGRIEADRTRLATETAEARRSNDETTRKIATARGELEALIAAHKNRPPSVHSAGAPTSRTGPASSPKAKSPAAPVDPQLRQYQVQAFVSDQRLRFAALLKRLGFTSDKLQEFDRIQGACQQVLLDDTQPALAKGEAQRTRDTQLKELFGPAFDQWVDANRDQPARAIVTQIVQQTFQSSGALTLAQADELTQIVGQRRIPPARETGTNQTRYDWDKIITDAHSILADRQMADFIAAIEFRRASEKMSALAAKRK